MTPIADFINMFGDVVMGVDHEHSSTKLSAIKKAKGVEEDTDLGRQRPEGSGAAI